MLCNYNLTQKYFINIEIVSFLGDIYVHVRRVIKKFVDCLYKIKTHTDKSIKF